MGRKSTRAWCNRRESTMQKLRLDILERRLLVVPWASKLAGDRSSPIHLYSAATSPPVFLSEKKQTRTQLRECSTPRCPCRTGTEGVEVGVTSESPLRAYTTAGAEQQHNTRGRRATS
jgi:hypothetical protein